MKTICILSLVAVASVAARVAQRKPIDGTQERDCTDFTYGNCAQMDVGVVIEATTAEKCQKACKKATPQECSHFYYTGFNGKCHFLVDYQPGFEDFIGFASGEIGNCFKPFSQLDTCEVSIDTLNIMYVHNLAFSSLVAMHIVSSTVRLLCAIYF